MNFSQFTTTGRNAGPYADLREALREKDEEKVVALLSKGVRVNDDGGLEEDAPLHLAIKYEASPSIIKLLLEKGADVACEDEYGELPLMLATEKKNVDVVQMIIEHGADVYITDAEGSTPLHRAAFLGSESLVELFLREELFIDIEDGLNYTALHLAAKAGHSPVVKLLLAHGANLHEVDRHGRTALHHAALGGHYEIACRLIDYEADVNMRDHKGRTCLHDAAWLGHASVVQIILNFNANINVVDGDGFTALHHAAMRGHEDVIFLLLERGADLSIQDEGGRTPLHHVILRGNYDMIKMLIEFSDDLNTRDHEDRTPFTALLSGVFSTTTFQLNHDLELNELLIKHTVRMLMIETEAEVTADQFIGLREHLSEEKWAELCIYTAKCVQEVKNIRNYHASENSISLYDFLTKKSSTLVQYAKNEDSGEILNSAGWDKEFPIYSSFLKSRISRAVTKRDLQLMGARCLRFIVQQSLTRVKRFPDVPCDIILRNMNELDLRNLAKACYHSPG